MTKSPAILLPVLAIALVGCGGGSATPTPTVTVTATATVTATPTTEDRPAASASATSAPLALGEVQGFGNATVQVTKTQAVTNRDTPAQGLLVKTCNKGTSAIGVDWSSWSLATAAGDQFPASGESDGGDPVPVYPFANGTVAPGKCAQGWIVFEVAKGAKVTEANLSTEGGELTTWRLA